MKALIIGLFNVVIVTVVTILCTSIGMHLYKMAEEGIPMFTLRRRILAVRLAQSGADMDSKLRHLFGTNFDSKPTLVKQA